MSKAKMIQIKQRFTDAVLFECEAPADLDSGLHTRFALEKATQAGARLDRASLAGARLDRASLAGASLDGASLAGASLAGASLDGASLAGASLDRASLAGARLDRASLDGASLAGASLAGASLDGARLAGARLDRASLVGERPVFQIVPIGSRCSYFVAYLTDQGVKLRAGCFFGTVDEFREKLSEEHGTNKHAMEYNAALELIRVHAELWTPAEVAQEAA